MPMNPLKTSDGGVLLVQPIFRRVARMVVAVVGIGLIGPAVESAAAAGLSTVASPSATPVAVKAPVKKKKKRGYSAAASRSRKARLARARAAARARQWREVQEPKFKLSDSGELVPDVRAAAAIIYNPETNEVLWESNSQDSRSIASITKVMTAAVMFEGHPDLTREVAIERSDVSRANHTYLRAGERVTVDDLLHLTLVASDNAAARALARTSRLGQAGFIQRMNEKALELGLEHTTYADPSGLLSANVSSAYDMARLISFASADERVASIMRKPHYTVLTSRRVININNTNQLLVKGDVDVRGGKTGFISKAGYCLATLLRLPQTNQQVAVVVLGARSNAGRFMETRHLFNWLSTKTSSLTLLGAAGADEPPAPAPAQEQ
jgi:serine-type D-Ala-D-Ala endopeptidase (penicillin-binding protein 7)